MRRLTISILTVVYLATPVAARAEVVDASSAGFTSENVAAVPVDATTAWKALVDGVLAARLGGLVAHLTGQSEAAEKAAPPSS